ncbi:MAG: hypothetical protein HZB66_01915 [Candidatus Aenigmarchaeota archaeon]|nr:hypothetical protein [Candidatus Aenigmarchaeota archaeon]
MYHRELIGENLKNFSRLKGAFLAYNTNIDNIVHVDSRIERYMKGTKPEISRRIKNEKDLFSGLLYFMKNGEAMEMPISRKVSLWLEKNMKPEQQKMGGQAGIMGNFLSSMEIPAVVYTPFLSKRQSRLFGKNVKWWKNFKHPKKNFRNDKEKINWIFEYNSGTMVRKVRALKNGRFIAASRPDKYEFGIKSVRKIMPKIDFALLSGFQNVKNNYRRQFSCARSVIRVLNKAGIPVHIELVASDKKNLKHIVPLIRYADSVGLDNTELNQIIRIIHGKRCRTIEEKFSGILKILDLGAKSVHFHYKGYFLAVRRKNYFSDPGEIKKSLEFAAASAAAEAIGDINKKKDVFSGLDVPLSAAGKREIKRLKKWLMKRGIIMKNGIGIGDYYDVIAVPNRMAKKPRDIVGLGDIVSASIFCCENAYSKSHSDLA